MVLGCLSFVFSERREKEPQNFLSQSLQQFRDFSLWTTVSPGRFDQRAHVLNKHHGETQCYILTRRSLENPKSSICFSEKQLKFIKSD